MRSNCRGCLPLIIPFILSGCQWDSRQQILASTNSQAAQRAISTRVFDTADQSHVFQAVVSSLQDLGFVIDRADNVLGTISATRYGAQLVRITVSIRARGVSQTVVRASGQLNQYE